MFLFVRDGSEKVGHVRKNWLCCFIVLHAHHSCILLWLCQSVCIGEICHDSLSKKSSVGGGAHEINKLCIFQLKVAGEWGGIGWDRESIIVAKKESKKIHCT